MNTRIQKLIETLSIKKVEFAKHLRISSAYVSELCSGVKSPSDRTIADICREFNVNEKWLRTGEGEMFIQKTRTQEIGEFIGEIMRDDEDNFKRRFVAMLSRLGEDEWELLAKMAQEMAKD